jgi:hypothetical protein
MWCLLRRKAEHLVLARPFSDPGLHPAGLVSGRLFIQLGLNGIE